MNGFLSRTRWIGIWGLFVVMALFASTGLLTAGEHPEHPAEHPSEHPAKSFQVDNETLTRVITDYVNHDAGLKGGYFLVFDSEVGEPLSLTLVKVHKDKLSQIAEDTYFACCDFREIGGTMYDLDFFLRSKDEELKVTEIMVHKEDSKPRYDWYEEGGFWKRKQLK